MPVCADGVVSISGKEVVLVENRIMPYSNGWQKARGFC
jgi:hypothetical protein